MDDDEERLHEVCVSVQLPSLRCSFNVAAEDEGTWIEMSSLWTALNSSWHARTEEARLLIQGLPAGMHKGLDPRGVLSIWASDQAVLDWLRSPVRGPRMRCGIDSVPPWHYATIFVYEYPRVLESVLEARRRRKAQLLAELRLQILRGDVAEEEPKPKKGPGRPKSVRPAAAAPYSGGRK